MCERVDPQVVAHVDDLLRQVSHSNRTTGGTPTPKWSSVTNFPVLTTHAPYWQHPLRVEIVADPQHRRGLGFRLLSGDVPDAVLAAAADKLVTRAHQVASSSASTTRARPAT